MIISVQHIFKGTLHKLMKFYVLQISSLKFHTVTGTDLAQSPAAWPSVQTISSVLKLYLA